MTTRPTPPLSGCLDNYYTALRLIMELAEDETDEAYIIAKQAIEGTPIPPLSGSAADDKLRALYDCLQGTDADIAFGKLRHIIREWEKLNATPVHSSAAEALERIYALCDEVIIQSAHPSGLSYNQTGVAAKEMRALLPIISAALAKEPVSLEKCAAAAQKAAYDSNALPIWTDIAKYVLDTAGVPYVEPALAEKGE